MTIYENELHSNLLGLLDHDRLEIVDCIYHVTGYLSQHILKSVKCDICRTSFTNNTDNKYSFFPAILLTNLIKVEKVGASWKELI